jgi:hypothetical protein
VPLPVTAQAIAFLATKTPSLVYKRVKVTQSHKQNFLGVSSCLCAFVVKNELGLVVALAKYI